MPIQELARYALASIRTVNGLAALLTPKKMLGRLGVGSETNGPSIHVVRMFGIRTVLLGVELFMARGERREELLRTGLVIHASDATSALLASLAKQLPGKVAVPVTLISCINTCLAFVARKRDGAVELAGIERG